MTLSWKNVRLKTIETRDLSIFWNQSNYFNHIFILHFEFAEEWIGDDFWKKLWQYFSYMHLIILIWLFAKYFMDIFTKNHFYFLWCLSKNEVQSRCKITLQNTTELNLLPCKKIQFFLKKIWYKLAFAKSFLID